MPVTITRDHLAVEVRVSVDTAAPPPEPWGTTLTRQLAVATEIVEGYAPDAPDDVLDEAVVLIVGYGIEAPHFTRQPQNAFVNSGARSLLSPWHELAYASV